jgi:hypothetical protein
MYTSCRRAFSASASSTQPGSGIGGGSRRKREPTLQRHIVMNITSKILAAAMAVALAACGRSTQTDVDQAARDRAADVAKAGQDAQPSVDAANRELAKAQQQGNAKVANAQANANSEIGKAATKQTKEQAKADYDVAIARADGDLSVALKKCGMLNAEEKTSCEQDANSAHGQAIAAAKSNLDSTNRQVD